MYTIITLPLIPLRASADECSELASQLLFGEQVEIIETIDKWLYVRNLSDDYEGWIGNKTVNKKHFTENPIDTSTFASAKPAFLVCFKTSSVEKIILPGGSLLPKITNDQFELLGEIYQLAQFEPVYSKKDPASLVIELAAQYFNAPYLWGGKSIFGIDCSGLVQTIFSMIGKKLPRDASQQVEFGEVVDFLSEVKTGDLAFFENEEGKIIHVGMLVNTHQIIHASGYVKKEIIDAQGIISSQTGEYTHKLRVIKRIL
ncbi:MAG: C40 family peptidase [Paludibacteraceae bacterium]